MNSFDLAKHAILSLSERSGVSGYEHQMIQSLQEYFHPLTTEIKKDFIGNFYAYKKGYDSKQTIMLAAHCDEIGLIVTHVDDRGFLHFATVGGIDERTLIHQEVMVHGTEILKGIISFIPFKEAHAGNNNKPFPSQNLVIDLGYAKQAVESLVKPGDIVSLVRSPFTMLNDKIVGKALDDRAGIVVMAVCLNELCGLRHQHNVAAVATVQEEVGLRGALTSSEHLQPDLAVAIDVTHAQTLDTKNQVSIHLGKGPAITLGPNIHPQIYTHFTNTAKEARIPYQIQPNGGPTGTDARVIQLTGFGIPTGLLSIPLKYMHTTVETASLRDIVDCGKLLAYFIAALPEDLEGFLCC
jgi:endoglucanase